MNLGYDSCKLSKAELKHQHEIDPQQEDADEMPEASEKIVIVPKWLWAAISAVSFALLSGVTLFCAWVSTTLNEHTSQLSSLKSEVTHVSTNVQDEVIRLVKSIDTLNTKLDKMPETITAIAENKVKLQFLSSQVIDIQNQVNELKRNAPR